MNRIKRVYKKEISNALNQARSIISDLHNHFNNTREYKFIERLVGSAQWNIVLKDVDGFFDLDFQLLLTKNSQKIKNFNYNKEKKNEATMIKEDFFNYMNKKYNDRERYKVENSTTSITFINKKSKYSIDFVLIKVFPENDMIIRRSNSTDNPTKNNYVWNKLSNNNIAHALFNNLSPKEKEDLIENYILPKKVIEKKKNINDPSLKSSSRIFKEEIYSYVTRKQNNRL